MSIYAAALAAFDQMPDLPNLHNIAPGRWTACLTQVAVCHLLLGDPASARHRVHLLQDIGTPLGGLHEFDALIEFATGDIDAARHYVRLHATEAITGRISRQCNDSILLFATLAHAEGNNVTAIDLLNQMGVGRSPGTIMYARHLAATLDIADQHATNQQALRDPANASEHGFRGVGTAMKALHTELARRGWQ